MTNQTETTKPEAAQECGGQVDPLVSCCSRCGSKEIDTNRWETGWPNYGRIELGFAAQAFGALCRMQHIAEQKHFDAWHKGHPAMVENGAQSVVFEWGSGYRFDSISRYRLCYSCQKELLGVIGDFFRYGS